MTLYFITDILYLLKDGKCLTVEEKQDYQHPWQLWTGQFGDVGIYRISEKSEWKEQAGNTLFRHSVVYNSFTTPWTRACQAPLSMGFSRQEYRSRLSFPCPGDLPNPVIKPESPALQVDSLPLSLQGSWVDSDHV